MLSLQQLSLLAALLAGAVAAPPGAAPAPTGADRAGAATAELERHVELGKRHADRGEYQEAVAEYREAYELKSSPLFLFQIAEAYRQLGIVDRSLFFYDRYLETRPQAPDRAEVEALVAELEQARRAAAEPAHRDLFHPTWAGDARFVGVDATAGVAPSPSSIPAGGPRPLWRRWWFWGVTASLVAGAVTAAVLTTTSAGGPAPPATDLGAKRFF
jgi:tetratricopeptide (TPR) repeat protein